MMRRAVRSWTALFLLACSLVCVPLAAAAYADDADNEINTQQKPDSSFIYDTSILDLGSATAYYDNQTVQVVGEVIGDNISSGFDGTHRWITLAAKEGSSTATVSVYMTTEAVAKIDTYGAYGRTGTTLQVRGTFHLVCPEHEGLSDLHADSVVVVEKGKVRDDVLDPTAFFPGIATILVGLAMMGLLYYMRERQR